VASVFPGHLIDRRGVETYSGSRSSNRAKVGQPRQAPPICWRASGPLAAIACNFAANETPRFARRAHSACAARPKTPSDIFPAHYETVAWARDFLVRDPSWIYHLSFFRIDPLTGQ